MLTDVTTKKGLKCNCKILTKNRYIIYILSKDISLIDLTFFFLSWRELTHIGFTNKTAYIGLGGQSELCLGYSWSSVRDYEVQSSFWVKLLHLLVSLAAFLDRSAASRLGASVFNGCWLLRFQSFHRSLSLLSVVLRCSDRVASRLLTAWLYYG